MSREQDSSFTHGYAPIASRLSNFSVGLLLGNPRAVIRFIGFLVSCCSKDKPSAVQAQVSALTKRVHFCRVWNIKIRFLLFKLTLLGKLFGKPTKTRRKLERKWPDKPIPIGYQLRRRVSPAPIVEPCRAATALL